MTAKERGDDKQYKEYIAKAQYQYKSQKENEAKAKQHTGKSF